MAEPQLVEMQVTDQYGHVESEPLIVLVQGAAVALELMLESGPVRLEGFVEELRAALEPERREAA